MKGIRTTTGIKIIGLTLLAVWVISTLYYSYIHEVSNEQQEFQELVNVFEKQTDFSSALKDPSNNFGRGKDYFYNADEYLWELNRIDNLLLQMQKFAELAKEGSSFDDESSICLKNILRGSYIVNFELQVISTYPRKTTIFLADDYYYQVDKKVKLALGNTWKIIDETKIALETEKGQLNDRTMKILELTAQYMTDAVRLAQMAKGVEDSR